ncbi:MAG: replication endonuclease [Thiovulaceae bacterium]|nr:replication endonuclease [Sulfurimonadaceae bacterium]
MYGLKKTDLEFISKKIQYQKDYLLDNSFITSSGQVKSLLDVSFSANHSVRYYAQLANKINTMSSYAKDFSLTPVFITITLDGFYRDFLKSDFSRFNKFKDIKKETILKSIPDNDIYGFLRQKIVNQEVFTIKDLYNVLNYQFKAFLGSYVFKKMKKQGFKYIYIRTVEPHEKDGVPHFHIMFWLNSDFIDELQETFNKIFPAPQNEKEGFVTEIYNPVGYVLKYITKSFIDVKNGNDIDYIQAWYIKHRIMRCVTSRLTVPQWVYQKCFAIEQDWFYLTDFIYHDDKIAEWSLKDKYFHFLDLNSSREIIYQDGVISLLLDDKVLQTFGTKKEKIILSSRVKSIFNKRKLNKFTDVIIDGEEFRLKKGKFVDGKQQSDKLLSRTLYSFDADGNKFVLIDSKPKKQPHEMGNIELYNYFYSLDLHTVNIDHYRVVHKFMCERGLIVNQLENILHVENSLRYFSAWDENVINEIYAEEVF